MILRPMVEADFPAFLAMKSDPLDVLWSGWAAPPDPKKFAEWFPRALRERKMLMAEIDGQPVGYQQIVLEDDVAECSYGVAAAGRGRGCCKHIIRLTTVYAQELPVKTVATWIAEGNDGSVRCVLGAGWHLMAGEIKRPFAQPAPHEKTMRRYGVDLSE